MDVGVPQTVNGVIPLLIRAVPQDIGFLHVGFPRFTSLIAASACATKSIHMLFLERPTDTTLPANAQDTVSGSDALRSFFGRFSQVTSTLAKLIPAMILPCRTPSQHQLHGLL